jgi:transcriptional regulator with XRE-family HTH domain
MVRLCSNRKLTFRNARQISGITLNAAARHLGISPRTLSHYEKDIGSMPLAIALDLLELYQIPREALIFL